MPDNEKAVSKHHVFEWLVSKYDEAQETDKKAVAALVIEWAVQYWRKPNAKQE